jgi:hypothetical protein
MILVDLLVAVLMRLIRPWLDVETTDTTPADLVVRYSVFAGLVVFAIWLFFRFAS